MPPADSKKALTEDEINILVRWVKEGAAWTDHWSFLRPENTSNKTHEDTIDDLSKNLPDHKLAERASKKTDSTCNTRSHGYRPPQMVPFEDTSTAYEKLIDRLLRSQDMANAWQSTGLMLRDTGTQAFIMLMDLETCGLGETQRGRLTSTCHLMNSRSISLLATCPQC